jgi:hypothetical protein
MTENNNTNALNRYIYKYRPLRKNDSDDLKRIEDIVLEGKLYLSSPKDFNDPFDMFVKLLHPTKKQFLKHMNTVGKKNGATKGARSKSIANLEQLYDNDKEKLFTKQYLKTRNETGVFSFAGDHLNILMWSHYADNHKGICLEFDRSLDFKTLILAQPVGYSRDYPIIKWPFEFKNGANLILLRKNEEWKYEKEERIICVGQAGSFLKFDQNAVSTIFIGCKAEDYVKEILQSLNQKRVSSGFNKIKICTAGQHDSKYEMVIEELQ